MLQLGYEVSGSLGFSTSLVGLICLLLVQLNVVVLEVPLSEWSGIDGHDAVLHDGLGSHKLVVRGVVNNVKNSGLPGDAL